MEFKSGLSWKVHRTTVTNETIEVKLLQSIVNKLQIEELHPDFSLDDALDIVRYESIFFFYLHNLSHQLINKTREREREKYLLWWNNVHVTGVQLKCCCTSIDVHADYENPFRMVVRTRITFYDIALVLHLLVRHN